MKVEFYKKLIAIIAIIYLVLTAFSTSAQSGYQLAFDKTRSQYITVPHSSSLNLTTTFTMEAWVNYSGTNATIVDKGNYDFLWQLNANGNANKMGFFVKSTGTWVYSAGSVEPFTPHHVAISLGGGMISFFIDGQFSGAQSASSSQDNQPMNIGRQQPTSCACNHFNGTMDELRIWNVARTGNQIYTNMVGSIATNSAGLVAYYKFDEGSGTTTADATANGNHGTLINGPTWEKYTVAYSAPGNYNYTIPPGVTSIRVQLWGGGAAGSVCNGYSGGGGVFVQSKTLPVTPGQIYSIVTGSGGQSAGASGGESSISLNGTKILGAYGGVERFGQGGTFSNGNAEYYNGGGNSGNNYFYTDPQGYAIYNYGGGGASGSPTGPGGIGEGAYSSRPGFGGAAQAGGGNGGNGGFAVNCSVPSQFSQSGTSPGGGGGAPFYDYARGGGGHGKVVISQCFSAGSIAGHTMPHPYELSVDSVYSVGDITPGAQYTWEQSTNNSTWVTAAGNITTPSYPLQVQNPPSEMYYRRKELSCGLTSNSVVVRTFTQANTKLNGTILGRVTSTNGAGVGGIAIRVQKTISLLGSPQTKIYTDTTDGSGNYQVANIFYGDVSNGDPGTVQFTVTPIKANHVFSPASSTVSLSNTNPTGLAQNFTDNTVYVVSGQVTQTCAGCEAGFTTDIVDSVKLLATKVFGVATAVSYTGDNGVGKYALTLTDPGDYKIKPSYLNNVFSPVESTVTIVNTDVANINFANTSVRTVTGVLKAGCNENIGTATLEFTDTVRGKPGFKFKKLVTTAADGSYSISLPARNYRVRVIAFTPNAAGSDIGVNDLYTFFNVTIKDSNYVNIDSTNKILDLIYHRPPVLQIIGLPDTTCGPYVVFTQNKKRSFTVNVWEGNPIHNCKIISPASDSFNITLVTSVTGDDLNDSLRFKMANGVSEVTLLPGVPNIISPYRKYFNLLYKDRYGRNATPLSRNVVVLGTKSDPGIFTTVSPEIPLLILHDPPGDNSYSFWQQDQSSETAMRFSSKKSESFNGWIEAKLGIKLTTGLFVSTENAFWGSINANMGATATINEANEAIVTISNSQYFSTANNSAITGDNGDVYIGAALNLLYSIGHELKFTSNCVLGIENRLMVADSGFATKYVYSENHIVNNVMPTLLTLANNSTGAQRDSYMNQVNVWRQVVANNAANKARAAFDKNISFDGTAGPQTFTTTAGSTQSNTIEFGLEINAQIAIELGFEIAGSGLKGGVIIGFKSEQGKSTTTTATKSTTIGYTIDDDDDGDYFSIDVKKDPVYGTPVFALVAGTASCPDEPGAQKRDQVQLTIPDPVKNNIPASGEALFELHLGNTSESREERTYLLSFVQGSNPYGAIVTIGGSPVLTPVPYTVPYLGDQVITVSVRKNQSSQIFSYEGLKFLVTDACGGALAKTATISAHFNSPCSGIDLNVPVNWRINSSDNNLLQAEFTEYTAANLTSIVLEHAASGSNVWFTDTTLYSGLISNTTSALVNWKVANIPDGAYDLRAKLICANGTVFSKRISGIIDRTPPGVFGRPEPTDDNYIAGDIISYTYNEFIDNSDLISKVELRRMSNNQVIPVQASGFQNKIIVVPQTSITGFTNDTMRLILTGITDVNGNIKPKPDTSYFAVGLTLPGSGSNVINLSSNRRSMFENAFDSLEFRFTLPIAAPNNVQVNYSITGTASYPEDYTVRYPAGQPATTSFNGSRGVITILKNTTTAVLRIKPVQDFKFEADETITVTITEGGDYVLGANLSLTDTIKNDDLNPPVVIKTGPLNVCAGQTLSLSTNNVIDGKPVYSYYWSNGNTNQTINVTSAGTYILTVYTIDGFSGVSDPVVVTFSNLPAPVLGNDVNVYLDCPGETKNLTTLFNTSGLTATWNTGNPTTSPAGTYRLVAANSGGCTDTAFANLIIEVATWTGSISTNWHTPQNWNTGKVPTNITHVIINTSSPNACFISTANAQAASIQARNGAIINVANNRTLTISGKCLTLPPN